MRKPVSARTRAHLSLQISRRPTDEPSQDCKHNNALAVGQHQPADRDFHCDLDDDILFELSSLPFVLQFREVSVKLRRSINNMTPAVPEVRRRLAAILAADVVGYTRLMEAHEENTHTRLMQLRSEVLDPGVTAQNGRIVKNTGDRSEERRVGKECA